MNPVEILGSNTERKNPQSKIAECIIRSFRQSRGDVPQQQEFFREIRKEFLAILAQCPELKENMFKIWFQIVELVGKTSILPNSNDMDRYNKMNPAIYHWFSQINNHMIYIYSDIENFIPPYIKFINLALDIMDNLGFDNAHKIVKSFCSVFSPNKQNGGLDNKKPTNHDNIPNNPDGMVYYIYIILYLKDLQSDQDIASRLEDLNQQIDQINEALQPFVERIEPDRLVTIPYEIKEIENNILFVSIFTMIIIEFLCAVGCIIFEEELNKRATEQINTQEI